MNEPVDSPHLADETLSLHLDGELDPERASAVARHLSACVACAARQEALAGASDALRAATVEPPSELETHRLIARALEQHGSPHRRSWWAKARSAPAIPSLAALVLAVLVATGLLAYDRPPSNDLASEGAQSRFLHGELPPEAFLGDIGDLDALTDAESLAFLEQLGPASEAPKQVLPMSDGVPESATTSTPASAAVAGGSAGGDEVLADGDADSDADARDDTDQKGMAARGAASAPAAATIPDRQASPDEAADILRCAGTIELSARRSDSRSEGEADLPLTWRLELAATGMLQGGDGLLLAFERQGGGLRIFFVRRNDCSIVRFLTSPQLRP